MNKDYWVLKEKMEYEAKREYSAWTKKEIKYLRDNFNTTPVKEIAKKLMRPETSVWSKAYRERLFKTNKKNFLSGSLSTIILYLTVFLASAAVLFTIYTLYN